VLGVTAGAGGGAIGAAGFGRAMVAIGDGAGLLGADFIGAGLGVAAFLGAAFLGAALLAAAFLGAVFLAFLATLALLAFFAGRAFRFATLLLFLAAARFACGRFFPLAFFFAMVSLLLGFDPFVRVAGLRRVAPKKSAVICARRWSRRDALRTLPA
jgi:ABC-type uncharacterized transport system permease subunit